MFLRLFEQNESHVLFKWFHELSMDYMGTLNAQFDPTEEQVKVSARISPTTRKEIQQQNQFNAKATHEAKKNQIL